LFTEPVTGRDVTVVGVADKVADVSVSVGTWVAVAAWAKTFPDKQKTENKIMDALINKTIFIRLFIFLYSHLFVTISQEKKI